MHSIVKNRFFAIGLCLGASQIAIADTWDVSISNVTNGNTFTHLFVSAMGHDEHLFEAGMAASTPIKHMAECGHLAYFFSPDVTPPGALPLDADTKANPVGQPGPDGFLPAGATTSTQLITNDTGNTHLSIVAMILPSNDGFVGMDSVHIPAAEAESKTYTYYLNAYDAGTEANNEIKDPLGSCAINQAGFPGGSSDIGGTGFGNEDTNTMVHIHRGVLGDTDNASGISDIDSRVHRWQNPVAKVVVTVTR